MPRCGMTWSGFERFGEAAAGAAEAASGDKAGVSGLRIFVVASFQCNAYTAVKYRLAGVCTGRVKPHGVAGKVGGSEQPRRAEHPPGPSGRAF
jgi:hypothetical protein